MSENKLTISYETLQSAIADASQARLDDFKADLLDRLTVAYASAVEQDFEAQFLEGLDSAIAIVKGGIIPVTYEAINV